MKLITALGNEPKQKLTIQLDNGESVVLYFEYIINQLGWFFGFKYNDVEYKNIRLTTSYNILRAYRNWLPFGIACATIDGEEPMYITDFEDMYATVYVLSKEDINTVETTYYVKD